MKYIVMSCLGFVLVLNAYAAESNADVHADMHAEMHADVQPDAVKKDATLTAQPLHEKKSPSKADQYKTLNIQFLGKRPYVEKVKDTTAAHDVQH